MSQLTRDEIRQDFIDTYTATPGNTHEQGFEVFMEWLQGELVAAEKRGAVKALTQIAEALT